MSIAPKRQKNERTEHTTYGVFLPSFLLIPEKCVNYCPFFSLLFFSFYFFVFSSIIAKLRSFILKMASLLAKRTPHNNSNATCCLNVPSFYTFSTFIDALNVFCFFFDCIEVLKSSIKEWNFSFFFFFAFSLYKWQEERKHTKKRKTKKVHTLFFSGIYI